MTDISVTAASVIAGNGASTKQGVAGATITAGQIVYRDPADARYKLADNDAVPTAGFGAVFMALNGAAAGQPLAVLVGGNVTLNAVLTAGTSYYLSGTAGGIAPRADVTTGDDVVFLGTASSTTVLVFKPIISGVTL